jgi:hypothetical protein
MFPLAIVGTALLANLLVAIAPSTKIDELYYHMLVPSRIVSDEAIHFYRMPWEAAIWPQMAYQIASAPVHAIGYPDAVNVLSWSLSAMLVWFAWLTMRANNVPLTWSALWIAGLCVGLYPVVWHVTGGAHAMGDLAMAAAIVAFADRERLLITLTLPVYGAMVSILLVSAASSKVSLLPSCIVLLCISAWQVLRGSSWQIFRLTALAFMGPWLIFYCPILVWTWMHSGSPFGPVLAGVFGPSIFSQSWITERFQETRANQPSLYTSTYYTTLSYSPLVWLGVVGAVFGTNLPVVTRASLGFLFGLQATLIFLLLPHDARFLGGVQNGLLIIFASHASRKFRDILASTRCALAACTIFLLPWLGIQMYYAKQFFRVSFGLERDAFYDRYVAFYEDFVNLDRLLPKDTVMLVQDYRLPSVYAPRPVFFDRSDLPPAKKVVLLSSKVAGQDTTSVNGYKLGEVIYSNLRAVVATYRTPDRLPVIAPIQVTQLHRQ